jgi:acyl-homoserine-lactone acylase
VLANWNGREDVNASGAVLFRDFWEQALALPEGPWATPFNPADPVNTPSGLNTSDKAVVEAFGDALHDLSAAHLPYNATLGTVQYVVRNGTHIALPGGPGDPDGDFNAIYQNVLTQPGADPQIGSSYIQAVTWNARGAGGCPVARTVLTYSESANPDSPYYADQTKLFSQKGWVDTAFCAADVAAQAKSVQVVSGVR